MNKIFVLGNIGRDLELKYTTSGMAVCDFSIADNQVKNGEKITEWHSCVAFQKTAENISKFFSKGDSILVIGKLQTEHWNDKDGLARSKPKILVSEFSFAGGTKKKNGSSNNSDNSPVPGFNSNNDDIPF